MTTQYLTYAACERAARTRQRERRAAAPPAERQHMRCIVRSTTPGVYHVVDYDVTEDEADFVRSIQQTGRPLSETDPYDED
jgi:hypothetical protein